MAVIRLYRRFYRIGISEGIESYSLINPTSLSAAVYLKNTSILIETVSAITKESDGVYFADLNPGLYSYDNTYDLKWTVEYLFETPVKTLTTSFKLNPINIAAGEIFVEIENQALEYEVNDTQIIEVIIL